MNLKYYLKETESGAGKVRAQHWLLLQDLGSVPSMHTVTYNSLLSSVPGDLIPLLALASISTRPASGADIHASKTVIYIN